MGVVANIEETFAGMANGRLAVGIVAHVERHLARNHRNKDRAGVTMPTALAAGLKRDRLHRYVKTGSCLDHHPPIRRLLALHLQYITSGRLKRCSADQR